MPIGDKDAGALAARIVEAAERREQIAPITDSRPDFDLADAYRVAAGVRELRIARGERTVGWKIGLTNASLWAEQGLKAPIGAPMYGTTVGQADRPCSIGRLFEPRIEPEIGLRLGCTPAPDMSDAELLSCVDAVTHGFELVQSLYPGWRIRPADAVAAFGMHGLYRHGPFVPIDADRASWGEALSSFTIAILRNGEEMDRGKGSNVLGGPISALGQFVRELAKHPGHALQAGDIVTTGALTRVFPVAPGERWTTKLEGAALPGLDLVLTE